MSTKSPTASPTGRATKGDRTPILFRIPAELLAKMDEKRASLPRNDAMVAALTAWVGGKALLPPGDAQPQKSKTPAIPAGTRLDKTQIGKRLTPKPKPGKAAPAQPEEEAV